jgi:toxin ParE1/3/4
MPPADRCASRVRLRQLAAGDIETAVDPLLATAGPDVTARFVSAAHAALAHIGRHPGSGSLRFSSELDIPYLRTWPLNRFLYVVFYLEREDEIGVWRILNTRRDIHASLFESDQRIIRGDSSALSPTSSVTIPDIWVLDRPNLVVWAAGCPTQPRNEPAPERCTTARDKPLADPLSATWAAVR